MRGRCSLGNLQLLDILVSPMELDDIYQIGNAIDYTTYTEHNEWYIGRLNGIEKNEYACEHHKYRGDVESCWNPCPLAGCRQCDDFVKSGIGKYDSQGIHQRLFKKDGFHYQTDPEKDTADAKYLCPSEPAGELFVPLAEIE